MLNIIANELRYGSETILCVFTVLLYSWRISYTKTLLYNRRNSYFFVFYYQFGVKVFCHDDFEFINFNVILIVPK